MKKGSASLDSSRLLRVLEVFAMGDFDALMNQNWSSRRDFERAARDYVPARDYPDFLDAMDEEFDAEATS